MAPSSSSVGRPAARWVLLSFLLLALVILLGVQGLSTRTTGRSATPVRGTPGPLASAGPVLIWDGQRLVSNRRSAGREMPTRCALLSTGTFLIHVNSRPLLECGEGV